MKRCSHDRPKNTKAAVYRCPCGYVWVDGEFLGRVSPEQGAAALVAGLRLGKAVAELRKTEEDL